MAWTAPRTWVSGEVVTAALLNAHLRDNLLEVDPRAWTAYTPGLGGATLGTGGTLTGRHQQVRKTVHFWARWVLGTGFAMSGPTLSLPVPRSASETQFRLCDALYEDVGIGTYEGRGSLPPGSSDVSLLTIASNHSLATLTATNPFTWVAGDTIQISGSYEGA